MNCSVCRANKIGPEITPFGGYLCSNAHLQCNECNNFTQGYCGACKATTKFLQMKFKSPKNEIEPILSSLRPSPLHSVSHKENSSYSSFPKHLVAEIETQSRLSEEQMSVNDCGECVIQNTIYIDNKTAAHEDESMDKNCVKTASCLKTLFMGATSAENSVCLLNRSDHHDIGNSLNADDLSNGDNNKSLNLFKKCNDARKENIFLYKEGPNDSNIINTSEVRFMDSSDILQNSFVNSKHPEVATPSCSNNEQQKSLSAKILRDFDSHNSAHSIDIVHNYLESCTPTIYCQAPTYNCQRPYCPFSNQVGKQKLEMTTVSVSTESDPSLKSTCLEATYKNVAAKSKLHDYFIMQAVGVSTAAQSVNVISDKSDNKPSTDMRMQKLLETLKEDTKITKLPEKTHLIKMPTQVKVKEEDKEQVEIRNFRNEEKSSESIEQLLNTYRAYFNAPSSLLAPVNNLHLLQQPQPAQQEPPLPQFQTVPCSNALAQELLQKLTNFSRIKPVPACLLNIPRSPIRCPESTCQRMIFVSDFCKHLVVDHIHLPMERIMPFQCKNFFLDARLFHCDSSKCHLLYLMCDKICDLGSSEYKNFLPILVMTTRISLTQMCDLKNQSSTLEYYLIWVTGIAPEELPISVSLTVWSRTDKIPSCHVVYSGQMYSIRNSQSAIDIWQSGRMLLLSSQEIKALTNDGKEMLNVQLSVH